MLLRTLAVPTLAITGEAKVAIIESKDIIHCAELFDGSSEFCQNKPSFKNGLVGCNQVGLFMLP